MLIVAACIFASLVAHVVACYGWWAWRRYALALDAEAHARKVVARLRDDMEARARARCGCELCDPCEAGHAGGVRAAVLPVPADRSEGDSR